MTQIQLSVLPTQVTESHSEDIWTGIAQSV